jgi:hypothetical protein
MTARAKYSVSPTYTVLRPSAPGSVTSWPNDTAVTSSVRNSAPNRSACRRMLSISSGPMMPSGKPGKFSTSVVVINAPPDCTPSNTSGLRFARAAYRAAV